MFSLWIVSVLHKMKIVCTLTTQTHLQSNTTMRITITKPLVNSSTAFNTCFHLFCARTAVLTGTPDRTCRIPKTASKSFARIGSWRPEQQSC